MPSAAHSFVCGTSRRQTDALEEAALSLSASSPGDSSRTTLLLSNHMLQLWRRRKGERVPFKNETKLNNRANLNWEENSRACLNSSHTIKAHTIQKPFTWNNELMKLGVWGRKETRHPFHLYSGRLLAIILAKIIIISAKYSLCLCFSDSQQFVS